METLAIVFILAVVVEALIEYFGSPIPSSYKIYAAALIGVVLCLAYGADLLARLGYMARLPYVGEVLTGLLIARGSNFINRLMDILLNAARAQSSTTMTLSSANNASITADTTMTVVQPAGDEDGLTRGEVRP